MSVRGLTLSCVLGSMLFVCPTTIAEEDPAVQALVAQLKLWESRYRTEMVNEVLDKLFKVNPDHVFGLEVYSRYQMHLGNTQEARWALEKIRLIDKNNPAVDRLRRLYRLSTNDKQALQQARILALGGRVNEALRRFEALFDGPPPSPELAREYWELVLKTPNGNARAKQALKALSGEYPDNTLFRLAYIESEIEEPPFDVDFIHELALLSKDPNVSLDAIRVWRTAVGNLEAVEESIPYLQQYLAFNPEDAAINRQLGEAQGTIQARNALLANPYYKAKLRGLQALEDEDEARAEKEFRFALQGFPKDPDLVGGLGYVRMREGKRLQAIEYFRRALKLDPDNQDQWQSMITTARFWQNLAQADTAIAEGRLETAALYIDEAARLDPENAEIFVYRADLAKLAGSFNRATRFYRQALRLDPQNNNAIRGLLNQFSDLEQREQAMRFIASLQQEQQKENESFLSGLKARFLQQDADKLTSPEQRKQALAKLIEALAMTPDDPWLRYDVAGLYIELGQAEKVAGLYRRIVSPDTTDPDLLFSYALVQSSLDEDERALEVLEQINPNDYTPGIVSLQQRLEINRLLADAEASNDPQQIELRMARAKQLAEIDPEFYLRIANSWERQGQTDKALGAMESYLAHQGKNGVAVDIDTLTDYVDLLIANQRSTDAINQLERLANQPDVGPDQLVDIADIYIELSQSNDNNPELLDMARKTLARLPEADRGSRSALKTVLLIHELDADEEAVISVSEQLLSQFPDERNTRLELVTLYKDRQDDRANYHIAQLSNNYSQLDYDQQVAVIDHMNADLDDPQVSDRLHHLLAKNPLDPDLYSAAVQRVKHTESARTTNRFYQQAIITRRLALLLENNGLSPVNQLTPQQARQQLFRENLQARYKDGVVNQAMMLINQLENVSEDNVRLLSQVQPTDNWQVSGLQSDMVDSWSQNNDYIEIGFDWSDKSGVPGQSELMSVNIPIEARFFLKDGDSWFIRVEPVLLDAGDLNMDNRDESELFGSVLLCPAGGVDDCPTGQIEQKELGASLAIGMETESWSADIGTIPLGFEIVDWVGGFEYNGDLGDYYWSVDLSKRPQASSLLSFAGTTDPRTNRVWGGVTTRGVDFNFGYDLGEAFGFWSSVGYHQLKGKNVADNSRKRAMGGVYWRILTDTPLQLTVGLNALTWSYAEDLSEFSFGQGAYYSPQSYASVSLPIDVFGRLGNDFSYLLRVIPSGSKTADAFSLYYPTEPDYQNQAGQFDSSPFYRGDNTKAFSFGMAYQGAVEWRFAEHWTIGATFSIERADFFEPSRGMIYLRYYFEPALIPVFTPPKPVQLYQNF